jgi:hypothetical protein
LSAPGGAGRRAGASSIPPDQPFFREVGTRTFMDCPFLCTCTSSPIRDRQQPTRDLRPVLQLLPRAAAIDAQARSLHIGHVRSCLLDRPPFRSSFLYRNWLVTEFLRRRGGGLAGHPPAVGACREATTPAGVPSRPRGLMPGIEARSSSLFAPRRTSVSVAAGDIVFDRYRQRGRLGGCLPHAAVGAC